MNSLVTSLNSWGERFLNFAGPMLWQSSLLILVLFALDLALCRRVRPAVRYALWLVLLVKLLLPPTLAVPTSIAWWIRPSPIPQPQTRQFVVTFPNVTRPQPNLTTYETFTRGALQSPGANLSWRGWLLLGASLVSLAMFTWMMRRWWQVARLLRRALPAGDPHADLVNEVRRAFGLRRNVALRFTEQPMSPAVCGLFRPVILLPRSLVNQLPPHQLRAVLLHELAHLKRGDVWVNCAQALLQVAYWWHPLLWLANARIRRLREEAVDDAVMLALHDDAPTYAPTLLEVAKLAFHRPTTALGLVGIMESRSALRQRIERLVDFRPPRKAGLTIASVLCVLSFAVLAVPMEQAPATIATQDSTPERTESASPAPVEPSYEAEEVKLRVIVLNKRAAGDVALKRKLAEDIIAKVKGGAAFSQMASVFSEDQQGREGGDWGWVQNYDRDGALILRKELADAAFSLKPGEISGAIETPEMICLMLVEDKRPAPVKAPVGKTAEASTQTDSSSLGSLSASENSARPVTTETNAATLVENGKVLFEMGNLSKAEAELTKAVKSDPQNQRARYYLDLINKANNLKAKGQPVSPTGRQEIVRKLHRIRLDRVFYDGVPLDGVIRSLLAETKKRDREGQGVNFIFNPNLGQPGAAGQPTPELQWPQIKINPAMTDIMLGDVLDIIVKVADKPIRYSIEDFGVVFSDNRATEALFAREFKLDRQSFREWASYAAGVSPSQLENGAYVEGPEAQSMHASLRSLFLANGVDLNPPKSVYYGERKGIFLVNATQSDIDAIERLVGKWNTTSPAAATNSEPLHIRKFKVDPSTFLKALEGMTPSPVTQTNPGAVAHELFSRFGVKLNPPKTAFFNDRSGELLVRATIQDLETIESLLQVLNPTAPQINIKAVFVELSPRDARALQAEFWPDTGTNQFGILTEANFRAVREALRKRAGADVVTMPEVTTVSGRQAQVQSVELKTVVNGLSNSVTNGVTNTAFRSTTIPFGPVLDIIPYVAADGVTIQMTVIPTITEFLGYDDPEDFTSKLPSGELSSGHLFLTRTRVRQITTSAVVFDGQTIVLANFPDVIATRHQDGRETAKPNQDKQAKQLIVFVTPTIIDAAGNRIHVAR